MGYQLRRGLREALGPDITGLQRAVALEIADDANETTRRSMAPLEDLVRWTGAKDGSVVRNALKRLAVAGWEFRVPIGKGKDGRILYAVPGRRMTFLVPHFTLPEGVAAAATSLDRKEEQGLIQGVATAHSEGATATPYTPEGVAPAHSEGAVAHSEGATATPYSSDSSTPQQQAAHDRARDSPTPRQITADEKREFGAFWQVHPKSRDMDKTRSLWIAAVLSGVDPKKITAAATGYANEAAQIEDRYVKQSTNWLRERRYEDRYTTRRNSGLTPEERGIF